MTARIRVRSYELDSFGHVNNAVYLQYLEAARCDYLLQNGLCFADFFRWERYPLLIKAELSYKAAATSDDILLIHGQSYPYRKLGFIIDYEIEKEGGGLVLAARLTFVFSTPGGHPAPAPEEFRKKFLREDF
ncbi:MAG: acyl-CoA thioesterase [Armatimonadetes bacterium]|nr:acyl-CoA thioesterase [Armatimonadota bacterium]